MSWNLQGKTVEFDEKSHVYTVDGERCISVTQLLKFKFPNKYARVSKEVLEAKAKVGTELHEAIEMYENFGPERLDLEEFIGYKHLKAVHKFEVVEVEKPVLLITDKLSVCGRLDQVQKLGEKIGLADIKHTATLDKEYLAYQLNLYRLAYMQTYGGNIEFLKGIHLNKKKRAYVDIPINEEIVKELLENYEH